MDKLESMITASNQIRIRFNTANDLFGFDELPKSNVGANKVQGNYRLNQRKAGEVQKTIKNLQSGLRKIFQMH